MKKMISETPQVELGGIFKIANKIQLPPFQLPLYCETGVQRVMWLNKIREFLYKFSKGIDDGRELSRKYGRE
jgi:hypothetical protein